MIDNDTIRNQNKPVKTSLTDLWTNFSDIWKSIAGLSTVLYVTGFIVTNLYLGQFGYYSASLLNSQYIVAGIWSLIPVLSGLFLVALIGENVFEKVQEVKSFYSTLPKQFHITNDLLEKFRNPFLLLVLNLVFTVIFWLFVGTLFLALTPNLIAGVSKGIRYIIVGFQAICVTAMLINEVRNKSGTSTVEWMSFVQSSLITTFFLVLYLTSFSWNVYGDIPSYWGGGKPRQVQLIVQNEKQPMLIATGIKFSSDSLVSETVELVLVTNQEFIIRSKNAPTPLSLKREIVEGVLYEVP